MLDKIFIEDLAIMARVGVPEAERAKPQRLRVSLELEHEFSAAARDDDLRGTIDYDAVCRSVLGFAEGRSWKLIEKLAEDIAQLILEEFRPTSVRVRVKKFVIPEAAYLGVEVMRKYPRD